MVVNKKKYKSRNIGKKYNKSIEKKKKKKKSRNKNSIFNNVSGYVHQIECHNDICKEYKKQINSLDDLFNFMKI